MNLGEGQLFPQTGEKGQEKNLVTNPIRPNHQDRRGFPGLNFVKGKTYLTPDIHLGDGNRACFPRILRSSSRLEGPGDFLPESAHGPSRADLLVPDMGKKRTCEWLISTSRF